MPLDQPEENALQRWGPQDPLSEAELALLAQLQREGVSVAGLQLQRGEDGQTYLRAYHPSDVENVGGETSGLSLEQLETGGTSLYEHGQYTMAVGSLALAFRLRTHQLGLEHLDVLTSANNLAAALNANGNLAGARVIQRSVFETSRRVLGADHPDTLTAANNLAAVLLAQRDLAGARAIQESVVETSRRALGAEHPDTLRSANNLAQTLWQQGDRLVALGILESVYETSTRVLGAEHPQALASASNLAESLRAHGALARVQAIQSSVFEARQRALGAEHHDTLTSASNLAKAFRARGDLAGARKIQESVLETRQRVFGVEHPDTLSAASNLAGILHDLGDRAGARTIVETIFEARQRVLGAEHPDTLSAASHLASTLRAQADLSGARAIEESVFKTRERVLGAEHPDTLTSANSLAITLNGLGDLAGARRIQESVLGTRQRILGVEHPDTLISANNLAKTLSDQGDLAGALKIYVSVIDTSQRVLGTEDELTLHATSNLALVLRALGDLALARKIGESILETRRRILGEDHPDTLTATNNLALTLGALGDLVGACQLQRSASQTSWRVLGADHPHSLGIANNLATTLHELGDHVAAGTLCAELLERMCSAGVSHEAGFPVAANVPVLADPGAPWPEAVLQTMSRWLPRLGTLLTQHLERLPHESWGEPYAQYELFHRRWVGFAALHSPDQLLTALSGLHGIRSWSQVQAERDELRAVAEDAAHPAAAAAAQFRQARESVNALRERIAHLINRIGPDAPDLPELRAQERQAAEVRRHAEQALAQAAPDLAASLGVLAGLTPERVLHGLQPDEAWLAIAPTEPSLVLLLRPGQPAMAVKLERLPELALACDGYCKSVRDGRQGALRDVHGGLDVALEAKPQTSDATAGTRVEFPAFGALQVEAPPLTPTQWLDQARRLCADGFWTPLAAHLQGVRRLHLVTAADQHELLLELGQPAELASLQVLRYSGLAAYQRSLLADVHAPAAEPLPLLVITDTAEHSQTPIPFTQLDAVVPLARGIARRVSAPDLLTQLQTSEQTVAVLISAHGDVARPAEERLGGGHVLLPDGVALDPKTLATLRGRIGWLMWVSCWAARVVHGGQGEPYGSMSTLQQKGLQGGIGCLAPVSDFYSPLLSTAVWHERLLSQSTGAALQRAKWRLLEGDWAGMEDDLQRLRQAYRGLMLQLLAPLREAHEQPLRPEDREQLSRVVHSWPCPSAVRRALKLKPIELVLGRGLNGHEDMVDKCLDNLLKPARERQAELHDETSQHVQRQLEQLCAVVVGFGPG